MSAQHSWSKQSSQSLSFKFILSSLDFAFNKSNCALDEDSAGVMVVGSRTKIGVPVLTGLLQQTSLNVATKFRPPDLTQLAVAVQKKKVQSLFRGSCNAELRFGQRRGCLVEWWQLLLSSSQTHSDILDVSRPQTNSDSMCVSLCAGHFDTVYLLVEWTCASTKCKTGQEVSSVTLAVLVPDPDAWSCGQSSVYATKLYATPTVM